MTVTLFGRPGGHGECVAPTSLVQFTCGHGDPVVELAGHHFLGGSWAQSLRPNGTALVVRGVAPGGRSVVTNAGLVVAANGSRGLRRLVPVSAVGLPDPPEALTIGDSVMRDARAGLEHALRGWKLDVEAQTGDTTFAGVRVAAAQRDRTGEVVIVELGTNESDVQGFTRRATQMLATLHRAGLVIWLTVHSPKSYAPAINDAIRRVVSRFPNAVVADWDSVAPPEGFLADGVHLNDRGVQAMVRLLAPIAKRWRTAAEGRGPLACAEQALAVAGTD